MDSNYIINVNNLCKSFDGKPAVIDVSLKVGYGQIFGILGPNGSGKTTTIRMLCGLLTPDSGFGTCIGYDILTSATEIKKHIGYIPQYFSLYKKLTVYENLMFMAELYGILDRENKVKSVMQQLTLSSRHDALAETLSGGWKQRLALAAALIHDPLLLILDEPTASIDPKARRDFWQLMHSLCSHGISILLSSHNMDDIERCHQIAYISNGRMILSGNINEIIKQVNLYTWMVTGDHLDLLTHQLQATPGVAQVVTFHDKIHVSSQNKELLDKAIEPYQKNQNFTWQVVDSTLEEVFIWLSKSIQNSDESD